MIARLALRAQLHFEAIDVVEHAIVELIDHRLIAREALGVELLHFFHERVDLRGSFGIAGHVLTKLAKFVQTLIDLGLRVAGIVGVDVAVVEVAGAIRIGVISRVEPVVIVGAVVITAARRNVSVT